MKLTRFFSSLFGLLGAILAAGTVAVSLWALDAAPVLLATPETAVETADAMLEAVCRGDYTAAGSLMQGSPNLGADRQPADEAGVLLWDAFVDSMEYSLSGACYATGSSVAQDVEFTSLDMSSVTALLGAKAQELLAQRVESAVDPEQVYDENGDYREDFAMEVLLDAMELVLRENGEYTTRTITVNLVYAQGRWQVVPDTALLAAISGGIAG